jgi:hypothetical protein
MGEGVEQRGSGHGFGEAYAGERASALLVEEMDSGANLLMALPEQEDEQRLREAAGKRRSLYLRSYEPPDGEEIGSLMRLFRQFLVSTLAIVSKSDRDVPLTCHYSRSDDLWGSCLLPTMINRASLAPSQSMLSSEREEPSKKQSCGFFL